MKKILLSIIFVLSVFTAFADKDVRFHMKNGEVKSIAQERVDSIFFDDAEQYIFIAFDGDRKEQLAITDVDSIKYAVLPQMVEITYADNVATVLNPFAFDSVSVSIDGAKVTVTSQTTKEIDYQLQGASNNGCFYGLTGVVLKGNFDVETAVEGVVADVQQGAVYNLAGRRVSAPAKGIYIVDGVKKIVK